MTYAEALLALDAAVQYGLVTGGPTVHVARCIEIVEAGRTRGIVASERDVDAAIATIVRGEGTHDDTRT